MHPNTFFYSYLNLVCPPLAKAFKRVGNTYQTRFKDNHKFVYDFEQQKITHLTYKATFNGYEYGKELVSETLKVVFGSDKVEVLSC